MTTGAVLNVGAFVLTITLVLGRYVRLAGPVSGWWLRGDEGSVSESHRRQWRPSKRQWLFLRLSVLMVGAGAAAFAILSAVSSPSVPAKTYVDGVDVGGLSRDEAITVVRDRIAKPAARPLEFEEDGQQIVVKPRQAGVWVNAEKTVDSLLAGRFQWIVDLLGTDRTNVEPVVIVDEEKMIRQIAVFERLLTTIPVESSLSVNGKSVDYSPGRQGKTVDVEELTNSIRSSVTEPRAKVDVPVIIEEPTVSVASAEAANAFALSAISGPVKVAAGSAVATIPAAVIGDALSFGVVNGEYVPSLDATVLYEAVSEDLQGSEKPRNARFKVRKDGSIQIVPSRAGGGVNEAALAQAVMSVLSQEVTEGRKREVVVTEGQVPADFTTADAEALGIKEQLSSFTQKFLYAPYRVTNIGQAAEYVDGTVLMPGEVFSMNDTIRERTKKNGYTHGAIIGPGGIFVEALGGGVSAATTAVWTGAFFAGMERVFTRAHSVYIPRYIQGLEATVAWGNFDMQFRNDSPYPVYISTEMTDTSMTVEFWGTRTYDRIKAQFGPRTKVKKAKTVYRNSNFCNPQPGSPGFHINVDRVFYQGDEEVKRETIKTIYKASPKVICGKKPKKDKDKDETDEENPNESPAGNAPTGDTPEGSDDAPPPTDDGTFENVPAEEIDVG